MVTSKINKTVGLLRKSQNLLPKTALTKIYKAFARLHFDYGDILYDQAFNFFFHQKLESIQYTARLAITGAIIFFHCPLFDDKRITLLSTLTKINCKLIETNVSSFTETLLFGNSLFDLKKTPLPLTHPLIKFYPLKNSKSPSFNMFNMLII